MTRLNPDNAVAGACILPNLVAVNSLLQKFEECRFRFMIELNCERIRAGLTSIWEVVSIQALAIPIHPSGF